MQIKRRDFLKASVAVGGAAVLGGCTLNALTSGKDDQIGKGGTQPGTWIPTACQGCTTWCAAEVFVQNGRAVKVRGNQLSKSVSGQVCPRGHLILQQLYDPDRIKVPMKRTNPQKGRGIDPKFVPISWDEALATAIAHVVLTEGLWSKEFVGDFKDGKNLFQAGQTVDEAAFQEKETHGLVKWWNLELKDRTPEWAEKVTLIPKDQIIRVAKGMGKAAPHVIVWLGPGPVMSPRGAYTSTAIHALNGLLGSVDNEGGTLRDSKVPSAGAPKFDAYVDEIAKAGGKNKKIDQRGTKAFPAMASGKPGSGVVTNNVANAVLANDPYDIKVAIGYWNNFAFSCTGADRWEKAMAKIPFFVHIVTNPSEMTQFADVVLPAAHHATEKLAFLKSKANLYASMPLCLYVHPAASGEKAVGHQGGRDRDLLASGREVKG